MKLFSLLLALLLALPNGGVRLRVTAAESGLMPPEAFSALNALLGEMALTLSPAGYDLRLGEEMLLQARMEDGSGVMACGEAAAALAGEALAPGSLDAWAAAPALGALLQPWEKESAQKVDLKEGGTARRQLIYALTGEEWEQMWPQVMEVLCALTPAAEALREARIAGKGTLKRYFDGDGREMGAYFYAQSLQAGGETREVRLEYGLTPGKGLYLAFRCPTPREMRNTRIVLRAKRGGSGAYTLSADVRETEGGNLDAWLLEGKTDGKMTLSLARRAAGRTAAHSLTLQMGEGGADYVYRQGKRVWLSGRAVWQAAELEAAALPAANGEAADVANALAARLLAHLRAHAPEGWQQLIHYLATDALINAQREAE